MYPERCEKKLVREKAGEREKRERGEKEKEKGEREGRREDVKVTKVFFLSHVHDQNWLKTALQLPF